MKVLFAFVAIAAVLTAGFNPMTVQEYEDAFVEIQIELDCSENEHLIPTLSRLAFHDCVGKSCDGCLNVNNPSNKGLEGAVQWMWNLYNKLNLTNTMSFADFVQIGGLATIDLATERHNLNCDNPSCQLPLNNSITFRSGRLDCTTVPYTNEMHKFPASTLTFNGQMKYFNDMFGLTQREVTAIMGAHTLGQAKTENSGYKGEWVRGEKLRWNNNYYKLLDGKLKVENVANVPESTTNKKWQWRILNGSGAEVGFQLNTDRELKFDIDVDKIKGTQCHATMSCKLSPTASIVEEYATSYEAWMRDFGPAYEKLIGHGSNLHDLVKG